MSSNAPSAPVSSARSPSLPWSFLALLSGIALWFSAAGDGYVALFAACVALLAGLACVSAWRAAVRARESEEIRRAYRTATEHANDGFYIAAPLRDDAGEVADFRVVDCNETVARWYGLPREALLGRRLSELGKQAGARLIESGRHALSTGCCDEEQCLPDELRGGIAWVHRRMVRVGERVAVTIKDISERKAHEERMARLAHEDAVTGIPNRAWLLNHIPAAAAASLQSGKGFALLFVDLDDFKHVNSTHGHAAGDRVLAVAAKRLLAVLRPADSLARFGGDEFVVVLCDATDEYQAARVAERMLGAFRLPFSIGEGVQLTIGASVGISLHPRDGADALTLLRRADTAMHAAKSEGKGQYRLFDHALAAQVERRNQLRLRMEAAAAADFTLHYQPRVDPDTLALCSMEALLRWHDPVLGEVSPAEFIPLAESSDLIGRIGDLVIDKACAQLAQWRAAGLVTVPVSINVSARQFEHGVGRKLGAALACHDIPPALLEVEITESAMMGEQAGIINELAALRALGVKLHVDDFGTGYSSLSRLQRLRMDVLKVDRAFTAELDRSAEGRVFFAAIVSMARALGMEVVAEGVETAAQLGILRELGCNEVQGFYISRPLPAALAAERYLRPAIAHAA